MTTTEYRPPITGYLILLRDGTRLELPAGDVLGFASGWSRAVGEYHRLALDPRETTDTNRMRALMIGDQHGWWQYRYPLSRKDD